MRNLLNTITLALMLCGCGFHKVVKPQAGGDAFITLPRDGTNSVAVTLKAPENPQMPSESKYTREETKPDGTKVVETVSTQLGSVQHDKARDDWFKVALEGIRFAADSKAFYGGVFFLLLWLFSMTSWGKMATGLSKETQTGCLIIGAGLMVLPTINQTLRDNGLYLLLGAGVWFIWSQLRDRKEEYKVQAGGTT